MSENEEKKIVEKHEFIDMFDQSFLPYVEKFCKRVIKIKEEEKEEIKYFVLSLQMRFEPQDFPLNFEGIEKGINLQLSPVTQSDIDAMEKKEENAEINS